MLKVYAFELNGKYMTNFSRNWTIGYRLRNKEAIFKDKTSRVYSTYNKAKSALDYFKDNCIKGSLDDVKIIELKG